MMDVQLRTRGRTHDGQHGCIQTMPASPRRIISPEEMWMHAHFNSFQLSNGSATPDRRAHLSLTCLTTSCESPLMSNRLMPKLAAACKPRGRRCIEECGGSDYMNRSTLHIPFVLGQNDRALIRRCVEQFSEMSKIYSQV
jgi:hypothetical protein